MRPICYRYFYNHHHLDSRFLELRRFILILILLVLSAGLVAPAADTPPEPRALSRTEALSALAGARPLPPSWRGKLNTPRPQLAAGKPELSLAPPPGLGDTYVASGGETALAIDDTSANNAVASYNMTFNLHPSIAISSISDNNASWQGSAFPDGLGAFDIGFPYDPWVISSNAPGEFLVSLIRFNANISINNSQCEIARSVDGGAHFTRLYSETQDVFQDRAMFDVDRSTARGGGPGSTHDGTIYLAYTAFSNNNTVVQAMLSVITPNGNKIRSIEVSGNPGGTDPVPFRGTNIQPLAGVADGSVYLLSTATTTAAKPQIIAMLHELTQSGAGPSDYVRSSITYYPAGQDLGGGYYGVNGFRIDPQGLLAIDRSSGPRHGWLYYIYNDNPNPANTALDQGDVHLAVSSDSGHNWNQIKVPAAPGKTQFFPMLDVDNRGVVHVAYYQNESGKTNQGVFNAGRANLYYLGSSNGGQTWTAPRQLNDPAHTLVMPDPPSDLSGGSYYLIGDYQQIHATSDGSRLYTIWTGYDNTPNGAASTSSSSARVYCTRLNLFNSASPAWEFYQ